MERFQRRTNILLIFAVWAVLAIANDTVSQAAKREIVLIAGLKSHGPEGNGIHDYAWSARLLKTMLENSNLAREVSVTTYLNGWPSDAAALENADTVMIISDGRDGHLGREAPHLATAARVERVDRLARRGCGLVTFHFSTFAPDALGDRALRWYGGYFDWEQDGEREWYSDITTTEAEVVPAIADHELLRGVRPFSIREEFYFDIRLADQRAGWRPIWRVPALAATKPHGKVVAWAMERPDGGRGFATTCGHFYDNWRQAEFRKTILNALAWTAHVPIPAEGVTSRFYSHEEIAAHLNQPELARGKADQLDEREDPYADDPYWYRPGHPTRPAEAAAITALPGFRVQQVFRVPEELGSWTALCVDPQGRLLASAQHQTGIHRLTVDAGAKPRCELESLGGAAADVGRSQGLLYAFDSLYITVSEGDAEDGLEPGIYRLRDLDQDDQFESREMIMRLDGQGEHGPHNLVVGPSGEDLYLICGNGTQVPDSISRRRPTSTEGIDHLVPGEFGESRYTPAGWVARFRPDGSDAELFCGGLRNSFDLAFHSNGDLFTFDSDMEWDLGAPWYRPTRICHLVSGGEFGWRGDAAKWPAYYEDSVAPVIDIGPGSPVGLVFGYGARFPAKYQRALFACDWTFGTIHAVHLKPHGSGYQAEVEEFVGGQGLPVTDAVIGHDGALYFIVGGRRLGSAVYRVDYRGPASTERLSADGELPPMHRQRRGLEAGHADAAPAENFDEAWAALGAADRGVRFAARVAVESQDVVDWRSRALAEADNNRQVAAWLALVRQGSTDDCRAVLQRLGERTWPVGDRELQLRVLRIYELAVARLLGEASPTERHAASWDALREQLRQFVSKRGESDTKDDAAAAAVKREVSRLLCFLNDSTSIDTILNWMEEDAGSRPVLGSGYFTRNPKYGEAVREMLLSAPLQDRMHHAQMLLWVDRGWSNEQRQRYFGLLAAAPRESRGGYWYEEFWRRIHEAALDRVPSDQRAEWEHEFAEVDVSDALPVPRGPGQAWTLDSLLQLVSTQLHGRDYQEGQRAFAAAKCISCHRFNGEGSAIGPDLTTLAQRFTLRDMLESTVDPNKAISDQYRVTMLTLDDGTVVSGRVAARDSRRLQMAINLMRPSQLTSYPLERVDDEQVVPVSTMPTQLLNPLGEAEVLDLFAYLVSGGDHDHPVFAPSRPVERR